MHAGPECIQWRHWRSCRADRGEPILATSASDPSWAWPRRGPGIASTLWFYVFTTGIASVSVYNALGAWYPANRLTAMGFDNTSMNLGRRHSDQYRPRRRRVHSERHSRFVPALQPRDRRAEYSAQPRTGPSSRPSRRPRPVRILRATPKPRNAMQCQSGLACMNKPARAEQRHSNTMRAVRQARNNYRSESATTFPPSPTGTELARHS